MEELDVASVAKLGLSGPNASTVMVGGRQLVNFTAPNYLGLTNHPAVLEAARTAMDRFGIGPGAGPTVTGRSELHAELEAKLAATVGAEAGLLFGSCAGATNGVLDVLTGPRDVIISDELNHASIVDACRLARAATVVTEHGNAHAVREAAIQARGAGAARVVIVTDGVFSIDGDIAPLDELAEICDETEAILVCDDAHGFGVLGNGAGTAAHHGIDPTRIVTTVSFSKAMGVFGGAATGPRWLIDEMTSHARSYIFSAALPPPIVAGAHAAIDLILHSGLRDELWANRALLINELQRQGVSVDSRTPIVPVIIGETPDAARVSQHLLNRGVLALPLGPPVAPPGTARIRFIVSSNHIPDQLTHAAQCAAEALSGHRP